MFVIDLSFESRKELLMKTMKTLFILSVLILALMSCKKETEPVPWGPPELDVVITGLNLTFDSLNRDVSSTATSIGVNVADTLAVRNGMQELFNRSSFVIEFAYVNPSGIMQIVEPAKYHYVEGSDISKQDHIVKMFQTKLPVLSKTFDAVEGFNAAVDVHPVMNKSQLAGGITSLFHPDQILGRIIEPVVEYMPFEIWVMEPGGKVLYDQDEYEIGRNVITDTLYAQFPELIAAAKLIDAGVAGETTYSFYQTGTSTKVTKKCYWKSFTMYGMSWRIIWVKPI